MSISELLVSLRDSDAVLCVDALGVLRYLGPRLAPDDPIRRAIVTHRLELLDLFVGPDQRCVFNCRALLAEGDRIACPEHRRQLDTTPRPWERRAGWEAA